MLIHGPLALFATNQDCFVYSLEQLVSDEKILTNPQLLMNAAVYALPFFEQEELVNSVNLERVTSPEQTLETLQFIIESVKRNGEQVLTTSFINKNFTFIKWNADEEVEHGGDNIRLTHYAIFRRPGSTQQSKEFPHAMYGDASQVLLDSLAFKHDIKELSELKDIIINDVFHHSEPFRFGRQNILKGVLNAPEFKDHVKPLVWVSQDTLEQALLQGGIFIDLPNGESKLFNVQHCNKIFYNRVQSINRIQERYWFFREIKNDGQNHDDQRYHELLRLGQAAFAHDARALGLGKCILLRYTNLLTNEKEVVLGILADVGGAFKGNLHQLDRYEGTFKDRESFLAFFEKFPLTVEAYILTRKSEKSR